MKYLKNKYIVSTTIFIFMLIFFDRYDLLSQINLGKQLLKLRKERDYYKSEIKHNNESLELLKNDSLKLEKFARENYFMKKDNEDIFVIVKDSVVKK